MYGKVLAAEGCRCGRRDQLRQTVPAAIDLPQDTAELSSQVGHVPRKAYLRMHFRKTTVQLLWERT